MQEHSSSAVISIRLHGPFEMRAREGTDLTPKSAKAQGLIALVAASPEKERSRAWLRDKLWSDRGREQGSSSLRQALSEIRRSLGPYRDAIWSDRQKVVLSQDLCEVLPAEDGREFLEGIDVRDRAFDAWLTETRRPASKVLVTVQDVRGAQTGCDATSVYFDLGGAVDSSIAIFQSLFMDVTARTLQEALSAEIYEGVPSGPVDGAISVKVEAFRQDSDQIGLRIAADDLESRRRIWSRSAVVALRNGIPTDDPRFLNMGNQLVAAIADFLIRKDRFDPSLLTGPLLGQLGIRRLFQTSPEDVAQADRCFAEAFDRQPRGIFMAWRAQLRGFQLVERHRGDQKELREEGLSFAARAMEDDPHNSMVLACVSNARLILDKDIMGSDELSRRSVEANPANPMAWWSRAAALLYSGRGTAAYGMARTAHLLSAGSPHRYWFDLQCALTAAVLRKTDEAIIAAERCAATAPNFRPPLRYLAALYAANGAERSAANAVVKLAAIEPDFSADRLVNDPSYPVSLARTSGLIDRDRLLSLG